MKSTPQTATTTDRKHRTPPALNGARKRQPVANGQKVAVTLRMTPVQLDQMKRTSCRLCLTSMRTWALKWRRATDPERREAFLNAARMFRNGACSDLSAPCVHRTKGGAR